MSNKENLKVQKKPIPDGGYGWVVLISCFVTCILMFQYFESIIIKSFYFKFISFVLDGIMYSFGLLVQEIKEHYDADESSANLIISLNTGFLFLSGPIVSGLTSSFGCRSVVMCGAIVTAFLYLICVISPSIYPIWVFYGILGGKFCLNLIRF